MNDTDDPGGETSLSLRVALLSILGFWLFYFAVVSVRSVVLGFGDQWDMLARRSVVTLVGAGATLLLYLVLRRIPRRSFGASVAVAALLAIPAAILYSTANWYAFRTVQHALESKHKTTKVVVIEGPRDRGTPPSVQVRTLPPGLGVPRNLLPPPPPPAPLPPMSVVRTEMNRITVQVGGGGHDDDEMTPVEAIADQAANGYFFIVAWAALYLALCYAAEVRVAERRAAGFRAAAQAAEIRALRYQVNPHFLFNTLNSLSSLVLTGKADAAERMIMNLSTFFRTSLAGDPTEDMRLDEEIRLQRLYLDIEAVRFPERLVVELDVPPALADCCIPGLILQPLVENAVKYGVSRARRPVTIRIAAREEGGAMRLSVEDDGDAAPGGTAEPGTGVGLRNVRERIAARFGDAGAVSWGARAGGGFAVTLDLPLVRRGC